MNEKEIIDQGRRAETLLKDENFNKIYRTLLDQYVGVFFNSNPNESEERNSSYYQARGLQEIVNTLNQQVQLGKQTAEANKE